MHLPHQPGRRRAALLAGVLTLALAASACSGDATGPDITPSTAPSVAAPPDLAASPAQPATPELPVPAGVVLTTRGSQLQVGETATVAYQPRHDVVGVLDITITRLEQTSFAESFVGWNLGPKQKDSQPFFVRATIVNRGESDLGTRRAPLYLVDATNTLVEPTTFASTFRPCSPSNFPDVFAPGDRVKVCLVYLAPAGGSLTAVSFRPDQSLDPITWTGPLREPKPKKKKAPQPSDAG